MRKLKVMTEIEIPEDVGTLRQIQERLLKIAMPWDDGGCVPSRPERKDGLGRVLAQVDPGLGGYQWPHTPERGWGYQTVSTGQVIRGIADTEDEAKAEIDRFLAGQGYTLVDEDEEGE